MASFADDHSKWQQARQTAAVTGSRSDAAEAERLRSQLTQHPAVKAARKQTDARPIR
ncbi:hypothetical protein [Verrucosispora sp. NA02020]|uniref:hypothetical protein n=1 Tax=Verrucosispora sp. NA02020 TaxID=2742132 RepID=UPI00158FB89C|nr:hypothetical protein [Verrucosispora sp. NA02020]QKW15437.1 hypothetical protein HUT12_23495 [Verrucosispora sp. NA02020]